jgi:hypothetical protein
VAWHHVEDTESVPAAGATYWNGSKSSARKEAARATIALSIWRCGNCRALAVTHKGEQPSGKCGACK